MRLQFSSNLDLMYNFYTTSWYVAYGILRWVCWNSKPQPPFHLAVRYQEKQESVPIFRPMSKAWLNAKGSNLFERFFLFLCFFCLNCCFDQSINSVVMVPSFNILSRLVYNPVAMWATAAVAAVATVIVIPASNPDSALDIEKGSTRCRFQQSLHAA